MTIARAQMYRQLYQLGGIGTLPMDYGQPLQVPQQSQSMFTTTGSATSSPLLNYGQTSLGQAGGTSLSRLGYQEGGLSDFYKAEEPIIPRIENIGGLLDQAEKSIGQPANNFTSPLATTFSRFGMQEGGMGMDQEPMMQPQMQQSPLEGIMGAMPQDSSMMQGTSNEEQIGNNAILSIIQLLIEQGIDPETARQIAMQILQAFAQGGEPAVEQLANELEQQEMSQERTMMAGGGITSINEARNMLQSRAPNGEFLAYINPQEAAVLRRMGGLGKDINNTGVPSFIFKSIGKAIKSVVKSDIGRIALTAAAVYFGGPMLATSFGVTAATGAAIAGGLANSALQLASGKKFNPIEALIAAGGAYVGAGGLKGAPTTSVPGAEELLKSGVAAPSEVFTSPGTLSSGVVPSAPNFYSPTEIGSPMPTQTPFSPMESQYAGAGKFSAPATPIMEQPNLYDKTVMTAKNIGTGIQDFGTNLMKDPMGTIKTGITSLYDTTTQAIKDNPYTAVGTSFLAGTQFRAPLVGEDPNEYNRLKAEHDAKVNQFYNEYTGLMYPKTFAANGGRMGFEYGSMPMGEPRKNPAGIMELDYRAKGGFVPPIGIKEKADDIPAMLSNNEFVFTANAVRNAGGGDVDRGAQRMYSLMKTLENGGRV